MSALRACLALTAQRETEEAANPIIYQVMINIQIPMITYLYHAVVMWPFDNQVAYNAGTYSIDINFHEFEIVRFSYIQKTLLNFICIML